MNRSAPLWTSYPVIRDAVGREFDILAYLRDTMNVYRLEDSKNAFTSKSFIIGEPLSNKERMDNLLIGKLVFDLVGVVSPTVWTFFPIFAESAKSIPYPSVDSEKRQLLGFLSTATLW